MSGAGHFLSLLLSTTFLVLFLLSSPLLLSWKERKTDGSFPSPIGGDRPQKRRRRFLPPPRRCFSVESSTERKVAILGAAGGIGQPLALLMKPNTLVSFLALYDIAGTPGVAADVSHINARAQVAGFMGEEQLGKALEGSDDVVIPAGVFWKPGMTRDDLFNINAGIVKSLCTAIAKYCPNQPSEFDGADCGRGVQEGGDL